MGLKTLGYAKVLKDERGRLIVDRSTLRRNKKGRFAGEDEDVGDEED